MARNTKIHRGGLDSIEAVDKASEKAVADLARSAGMPCYLFLSDDSLTGATVANIYEDLRDRFGESGDRLTVVVHNGGGDINAAYNLAGLFRRYGRRELIFIVPRWAKSAATLLVCAGDKILMAPPAELGPLDPQIHAEDSEHVEHFSPIHISSAMSLIREEYRNGHDKFADALMAKLQFPLTLGSYLESLKIGEVYLERLLASRMLKGEPAEKITEIAKKFAQGYTDHAYCISVEECQSTGLNVEELTGELLTVSWSLVRLFERRGELEARERRRKVLEKLRKLPPDALQGMPPELLEPDDDEGIASTTGNGEK